MSEQTSSTSTGRDENAAQTSGEQRDAERAAVQTMLDQFARALTAGDGKAAAKVWGTPALVASDQDVRAVQTTEEVENFFSGAKEQYTKMGITDTRAEITRLDWLTERIANVQVRWPYLDAHNREQGSESSTYTLRKDDGGRWKIRAVVMMGVSRND